MKIETKFDIGQVVYFAFRDNDGYSSYIKKDSGKITYILIKEDGEISYFIDNHGYYPEDKLYPSKEEFEQGWDKIKEELEPSIEYLKETLKKATKANAFVK